MPSPASVHPLICRAGDDLLRFLLVADSESIM
jgi:hypothetical protein